MRFTKQTLQVILSYFLYFMLDAVWDRFLSLLTKWDRLSLTRSTNLLESLGNTTVICCLDREGTIANVSLKN